MIETISNPVLGANSVGFLIPFAINCILMVYTAYQLVKVSKKHSVKYRQTVFSFIFFALCSRCGFEADAIYNSSVLIPPDSTFGKILQFFDNLPIFVLISIASLFSTFWHELYSRFGAEGMESHYKFKKFLFILNVCLYLLDISLTVLDIIHDSNFLLVAIFGIAMIGLCITILILAITGKRFYQRTIELGNIEASGAKFFLGFWAIYFLVITSCLIKFMQQSAYLFSQAKYSWNYYIFQIEFVKSSFLFYFIDIVYVLVGYTLAETIFFFCLIIMLNRYADRSEMLSSNNLEYCNKKLSILYLILVV